MNKKLVEKIYAGFIGMNIGIQMGAPVEAPCFDFETLTRMYDGLELLYQPTGLTFAADDDANGPVYFLRGLIDNGIEKPLTPHAVAQAWLNYTRNTVGMFWWGGEGVSSEHTAYNNLKRGIDAPRSGSTEQNGEVIAQQIGGQIFIDTWGLIWPGNPHKAAEYAGAAASVSHDGEGIYGGQFIAACIASSFTAEEIDEILDAGLSEIPEKCEYARVVNAVRAFHAAQPDDWRLCMRYLTENWGYDRYPGACHIIPNGGVCVLAMLYGSGNFNETVEIATKCGWDTDCNAGNVGTVMGVLCGIKGISGNYRRRINDVITLSGISGAMNILDCPSFAKKVTQLAEVLSGESMVTFAEDSEIIFDFELEGATHGFRLSDHYEHILMRQTFECAHSGEGSLEIVLKHHMPDRPANLFWKPYYRRKDFVDERYDPVFSPTVYSGQQVKLYAYYDPLTSGVLSLSPYVRLSMQEKEIVLPPVKLHEHKWEEISFILPDSSGDVIDEVGVKISAACESSCQYGRLFIDDFSVSGRAEYSIEPTIQKKEFKQITPFSYNQCQSELKDGRLIITAEERSQSFVGNYFSKEEEVTARLRFEGSEAGIILRGQGAQRYYSFGFAGTDRMEIAKYTEGSKTVLSSATYSWQYGEAHTLMAKAHNEELELSVDGEMLLKCTDSEIKYGMVGLFTGESGGQLCLESIYVTAE